MHNVDLLSVTHLCADCRSVHSKFIVSHRGLKTRYLSEHLSQWPL